MVYVMFWLVFAAIASCVGMVKGRPVVGLLLGFFLGLIGVIAISLIPAKTVHRDVWQERRRRASTCPWCSMPISPSARRCGQCFRSVAPSAPPPLPSRRV